VDDASTDDTAVVSASFGDPRVQYVRQKQNVGIGANWGHGVRLADTPFVCLLMDDDYYDPSFLDRRLPLLAGETRASLVFSGYRNVDARGTQIGIATHPLVDGQFVLRQDLLPLFYLQGGVFIGAMLFRREPMAELWDEMQQFDLVVDFAIVLRLATSGAGAVFCDAIDFNMTSHPGQMFHSANGRVWQLTNEVIEQQIRRVAINERRLWRAVHGGLLTEWALADVDTHRWRAMKHLIRSVAVCPYSPERWRRQLYTAARILGVK
jgi:glycosyltransferase involved in cell wall biosynthesis